MKYEYGKLNFLDCGKITARGWLKEQLLRSADGMGGHLDELEPGMISDPYLNKKTIAAWGKAAAGWGAEIAGNYWYGLIALAFTLPDENLQKKAENWVNAVLANQEEDGYLGAYGLDDDRTEDYNAWGSACGMRALLLYAEATGREDIFKAVYKGLLWFCENWQPNFTAYAGHFIIRLMSYFYQKTGDKRLLEFCHNYEEWLNNIDNDTFLASTDSFLSDEFYYNQNHAAGYTMHICRPAALYRVDGDKKRLEASINAVKKLHKHCLQVNGGITGNAEWLSPKSATAETETCTTTYVGASYAIIGAASGDSIYGDYLEQNVFNAVQGTRKKDEKAISYFTAPNQLIASDHSSHVHDPHGMYAPLHCTSCCSVNSVIVLPEFIKNCCLTDKEDNLYFFAYAPYEVKHKGLRIISDTEYPFRKTVKLHFKADTAQSAEFSVNLKIPYWCKDFKAVLNGIECELNAENGYCRIGNSFKDGDVLELTIGMEPRVVETDDTDACDKHPLSILYGPLTFSIPVKEEWINKGDGYANKPLPDGWYWYEVKPADLGKCPDNPYDHLAHHPWNVAVDPGKFASSLKVEEVDFNGYVWENPPIKITADGWKAPFNFAFYKPRTFEFYGKTSKVTEPCKIEFVPYGCTNLRLTCLPKAELPPIKRR